MTMIAISNCPDSGLPRFVISKKFTIDEEMEQIILNCKVGTFKDGILINTGNIKPYWKPLVATKDTWLNLDGTYLSDSDLSAWQQYLLAKSKFDQGILPSSPSNPLSFVPISEYDFFFAMMTLPVVMQDKHLQIIALRDGQGKLNIKS